MSLKRKTKTRAGAALLVVLFIVMIITVLSLGFLSQSDTELACGNNMLLRTQMDYLAESGLEHARGLILHPQDVSSEYWTGAASQQLTSGSSDYYDVAVSLDPDPNAPVPSSCNYIIDCNAYRLREGQRIGFSGVRAKLRLDPCIALWTGADTIVTDGLTINGDVYSNGNLAGSGMINGDAFTSGYITASSVKGRPNENVVTGPVDWPDFDINNFSSTYYIDSVCYSVEIIEPNISNIMYEPGGSNPAGICYYQDPNNPVSLRGNVTIHGTLAVNGDLTISGVNNVHKEFPGSYRDRKSHYRRWRSTANHRARANRSANRSQCRCSISGCQWGAVYCQWRYRRIDLKHCFYRYYGKSFDCCNPGLAGRRNTLEMVSGCGSIFQKYRTKMMILSRSL